MARKMTTIYTCDMAHDGDPVSDGVEELAFALDGASYEIDLCPDHAAEMRDAFAPFVGSAQKTGRGSAGGGPRRTARSSFGGGRASSGGSDREEVQKIREWARENGHTVSERGRLSSSVLEAYRAAH